MNPAPADTPPADIVKSLNDLYTGSGLTSVMQRRLPADGDAPPIPTRVASVECNYGQRSAP